MNKTICWYCKETFEYDGEQCRDVNCPYCGVQNSIYNPENPDCKPENQPKTTQELWLEGKGEEEMKPVKRNIEYEKVAIGEMLPGVIDDILYDQEHKFKGFQGKEDTVQPAVRFKFMLDGYKFHHYSRWFKFSYAEKANLYKIFLVKLVENAKPDMDLDLDLLKGMRIKTIWAEQGDFQNLESIFPVDPKVKATDIIESSDEDTPPDEPLVEEEIG